MPDVDIPDMCSTYYEALKHLDRALFERRYEDARVLASIVGTLSDKLAGR